MKINRLNDLRNKVFYPPHGMDDPNKIHSKPENWYNYPIQNYVYAYNSWGFRDRDFNQYINQEVILCLGDSFTVNIGGPAEHSWPGILQTKTNIPVLNFGVDGLGNDGIHYIFNFVAKLFKIKHTFVVYSFFHRRIVNGDLIQNFDLSFEENIDFFKSHMLPTSSYSFLPLWCWDKEERKYIFNNYESQSALWEDLLKIKNLKNRDEFHMSQEANNCYSNYFEKFL